MRGSEDKTKFSAFLKSKKHLVFGESENRMNIYSNRRMRFMLLVVLCLTHIEYSMCAAAAQSLGKAPQSAKKIDARVEDYMKAAVKAKHFSGSILIARNGQPLVSKGYGMANYELDVPNTPQTVFRIGSMTKQFTAMSIMMLQERGKLRVGDSIGKYLKACPIAWRTITIRHLLTHTSGIPNYTSLPDFKKAAALPVTHEQMVGRFKPLPLEFKPGESFNYSNSNYYLLGLIIEKTSGQSYEAFLRKNIFVPLGMKQSGIDNQRRLVENRAGGYFQQDGLVVNDAYQDMSQAFAAGALLSTPRDLLLWDRALYTEKLISRASRHQMFTPFKEQSPGEGYAYGWVVSRQFGRPQIAHGGSVSGFSSYIARFPSDRVTVIVLGNKSNVLSSGIAQDLSAIIFGAPYQMPRERKAIVVALHTLDKYRGLYRLTPHITYSVTVKNGKLMGQMGQLSGQPKAELFAETETKFYLKAVDAQITFIQDNRGEVTGMVVYQGGFRVSAPKIK